MFTTKKKKNYVPLILAVVIVVLCALIFIIAWPAYGEENQQTEKCEINANAPAESEAGKEEPFPNNEFSQENKEFSKEISEENNDEIGIELQAGSYYIVKRAGEAIKVYFVNCEGQYTELETTAIVYDVLNIDDQKLFDEGIKVKTQEELSVLLQDFES